MRYTLLAVFLFAAAPAAAQTVESRTSPAMLGLGDIELPRAINTDADEDTQEWLIQSVASDLYRVVAVTAHGLCAGPWFQAAEGLSIRTELQRVGRVHKLVSRDRFGVITITALDTPVCQPQH